MCIYQKVGGQEALQDMWILATNILYTLETYGITTTTKYLVKLQKKWGKNLLDPPDKHQASYTGQKAKLALPKQQESKQSASAAPSQPKKCLKTEDFLEIGQVLFITTKDITGTRDLEHGRTLEM